MFNGKVVIRTQGMMLLLLARWAVFFLFETVGSATIND
jgi:hypothetical protein